MWLVVRAPKTGVPVKIALKYRTIGPRNPSGWRYAWQVLDTGEFPLCPLVFSCLLPSLIPFHNPFMIRMPWGVPGLFILWVPAPARLI